MNLINPPDKNNTAKNPLADIGDASKNFFTRTGESIERFAVDTREKLKNLESPGWRNQNTQPWWNPNPDIDKLTNDLRQLGRARQSRSLPPQPQPRTARDFGSELPRHRF